MHSNPLLILVSVAVGYLTFLGTMIAFGLNKNDRLLADAVRNKLRGGLRKIWGNHLNGRVPRDSTAGGPVRFCRKNVCGKVRECRRAADLCTAREITSDAAVRIDEEEQKMIEERLKALGYI